MTASSHPINPSRPRLSALGGNRNASCGPLEQNVGFPGDCSTVSKPVTHIFRGPVALHWAVQRVPRMTFQTQQAVQHCYDQNNVLGHRRPECLERPAPNQAWHVTGALKTCSS